MSVNRIFNLAFAGVLLIVFLAYSNHFTNGFYFDDVHTIVDNIYIRDLGNVPHFFTDTKYYGTMPNNRGYNPLLVTLNAIDYAVTDSLNPVIFHSSIFASYLLLLVLIYVFFRNVLNRFYPNNQTNKWFALAAIGWYGVLTGNAETINYIIMRSDSFSTLCVMVALVMFQYPVARKFLLYLIPVLAGLLVKESVLIFGVLLFVYHLVVDNKTTIQKFNLSRLFKSLVISVPAIGLCALFFAFLTNVMLTNQEILAPEGAPSSLEYFVIQWKIIVQYLANFILPLHLSVDHDFVAIANLLDQKTLFSLVAILLIVISSILAMRNEKLLPVTFGIWWFFIALAPTSSFKPLGQLANDHRTFFPYIGLIISLVTIARYWYERNEGMPGLKSVQRMLAAIWMVLVIGNAYGTYQRNKVWSSDATLWGDAVKKSPKSARVQMNYGLTLMAEGNYAEAEEYFMRAYDDSPGWAYININLGILKSVTGDKEKAEFYFRKAIQVQPVVAENYYYYAKFLDANNRSAEALVQLEKGLEFSPGHAKMNAIIGMVRLRAASDGQMNESMLVKAMQEANDPNALLEISLQFYRLAKYDRCIEACEKALSIKPDFALAYNNICSAHNEMGRWKLAEKACIEAVALAPDFELAKNNLALSRRKMEN